MVAGSVAPPRIDLRNSDLVRSHIHALWMEVAKPDLGKTLTSVLDIQHEDGRIELPVKDSIKRELENPAHRAAALAKAERPDCEHPGAPGRRHLVSRRLDQRGARSDRAKL